MIKRVFLTRGPRLLSPGRLTGFAAHASWKITLWQAGPPRSALAHQFKWACRRTKTKHLIICQPYICSICVLFLFCDKPTLTGWARADRGGPACQSVILHETAAVSAQVLCTLYNHAPCHFMQSHIRKVYACLAVTCHLHFWQNDRGLLRATAVTWGWNGYRNKSQHRKSTLEKKISPVAPSLLLGFEPATFQSRVRRSNHWAIPGPRSHDTY